MRLARKAAAAATAAATATAETAIAPIGRFTSTSTADARRATAEPQMLRIGGAGRPEIAVSGAARAAALVAKRLVIACADTAHGEIGGQRAVHQLDVSAVVDDRAAETATAAAGATLEAVGIGETKDAALAARAASRHVAGQRASLDVERA